MTPAQCRAARALLEMTQTQLAKAANLGLSTVVDFEKERRQVSQDAVDAIRATLEATGISFLDENGIGVGVRCRKLTHARLKGSERERLCPPLRTGSKGSGRTVSSSLQDSTPTILPPSSSLRRKDLNKSDRVGARDDVTLTSELVRAARGLLRWAQPDLSAASLVSLASVKRLEAKQGVLAANATTVAALRRALEAAGVEFTGGTSPGVKLKGAPVSAASDQRRRGRKKEPQR